MALGPFVLQSRLGVGGMGEVWRARHRQQGVSVAVKVLTASGSKRPMFVESFRNEVRAVAALDHPHIVMVLDQGAVPAAAAQASAGALVEGTPYLAMELVEGETLAEHMGTLPWPEIERVLRGLIDALAHAHARGTVHRDLKLSNVLYDPRDGTFKLTDFGIAHVMAATGDPFRWGTPAYMPPEQLLGRWWDYGPWTDLYSLGCCAWGLVCGERPFSDDVAQATARRTLPQLRPRMRVPDGLQAWLDQLCAPDPAARYQRAADAGWALYGLCRNFVSREAVLQATLGRGPRVAHTTTLAFEQHALEDEETLVPSDPSPLRLPPMPRNWRRRRAPRRSQKLWGAGLGLFGLRRVPMVARVRERDLLWDALDEVRRDRVPRAFIVQGAPGSGKSRLGEWLCERAHEVGIAHVMRASHGPGGGPSDGLAGMLSTFLRTGGLSVGQVRQRVTAAMEAADQTVDPWEVHTLVSLLRPDEEGAAFRSPSERHGVVRRFVEKQAARRPVVLFLDDVHWSLDTLEFAHALLRTVTDAPVLVLLVARDDLLVQAPLERAVLDDIAKVAGTLKIPLLPLAEVDQRSLVEELLGLEGAVARLVEERSAGNPGFAVQLVGDWVQRGILVPGRRGFDLRDGAEVTLPDDLYTAWATRIEELLRDRSRDDRAALELAALLGQRVDRDEWRAACVARGLSPSADLVDTLLSLRLAVPDEAGAAGSWKFAHAMLRESLERSAEEHLRAPGLHRACAAMVAASGHPNRERLARHLLGAGSLEPALDPLVDAIEARNRAGEFDRADGLLELWEFAVGQLGLPDGDPRWVRGLRAAVAVHRYKDRPEQLLRICRQLEDGVRRHGWPEDLLVYVRMQEGRLARMAGDFDRAVELFREGLELVRDPLTRANLHARVGQTLVNLGAFREAEAELRACLAISRLHGDELGCGDAWIGLAGIALHEGELEEAGVRTVSAREHYLSARHRWGLATCQEMAGEIARHQRAWDTAITHYRDSGDIWRALGTDSAALYSDVNIAMVEVERGRAGLVATDLEGCAARAEAFGIRSLWATVRIAQLVADAQIGQPEAWDRHLAEGAMALAETSLLSPDVAMLAERAAEEAGRRGWDTRVAEMRALAMAQWQGLGRQADVERVARHR